MAIFIEEGTFKTIISLLDWKAMTIDDTVSDTINDTVKQRMTGVRLYGNWLSNLASNRNTWRNSPEFQRAQYAEICKNLRNW